MTSKQAHWQAVYETKAETEVSWFAEHLEDSLRAIAAVATPGARIVDVGAGSSTLVDDLLGGGYGQITALDLSAAALEISRQRLGERGASVQWISGDVTTASLGENVFDVWHDRAVLHFLTSEDDREQYVAQVTRSLCPGGHVVVGTFSLSGPDKCSGLNVVRYDTASLAYVFGVNFELTDSFEVVHTTPGGREQNFLYCVFSLKHPK